MEGAAFSISSNSTSERLHFSLVTAVQLLLREHGLGFAMAQIAGRRADQLGHLVLHLELAAIHLEDVFLAAVQHVGQRFDGLGLARAGGAEQQKDAQPGGLPEPGRPGTSGYRER